jgi:hypothetical protein
MMALQQMDIETNCILDGTMAIHFEGNKIKYPMPHKDTLEA